MEKPIILTSACLEFEKVRYDGQSIPSRIIKDLMPFVKFIKVCPEFEIGLGVPREPVRIVKKGDELRLIQHNTERDVTVEMNNFCDKFIDGLKEVDAFIFKSKSPSMGVSNIKVYSGMKGSGVVGKCGGFFATRISERFEGYPIEEDDRLRNKKIRDDFLTRAFLFSAYRNAQKQKRLKEFHENNLLLFEFYNMDLAKSLDYLSSDYFRVIKKITGRLPSIDHTVMFFEKLIGKKETIISKYKDNKASLETLKEVSKLLLKDSGLLTQSFFNPYPESLIMEAEDDRNRNYWKDN
jgi:uncharacterized protein YbbK (DUF523 family)